METVGVAVCDFPDGVLHPVCGGTDYVAPHHLGSVLGHAIDYPAMAVAVGLAFGEIPDTGEVIGVALVICAVIVTFSGDASLAKGK